jgi:hypothetical protein
MEQILYGNLIFTLLVKFTTLQWAYGSLALLCSQKPATGLYSEEEESSLRPHTLFL